MSRLIVTPVDVKNAVRDFLFSGVAVPDEVKERLIQFQDDGTSPVDAAVMVAELTYARAADLPKTLLQIGMQAARITDDYNFHGMRANGRAKGIIQVFKNKHAVTMPDNTAAPTEPPTPDDRYTKKPTPAPAPAPAPTPAPAPAPAPVAGSR